MAIDPNALMNNRLLQSILLSAGSSLNPQGISPGLDKTLQPVIAAQSQNKLNEHYMKMLSSILGGKVPAGGKMTMDETGTKFQIPHPSGLDTGTSDGMQGGGFGGGTSGFDASKILNPSNSQQELTASDFAGLSSKDVSAALGGALNVQELMQKTIAQAAEAPLREAKTAEALANAQRLLTPKDERTNLQKNFEYARDYQGFKGTLKEFQEAATGHQKDYEKAVSQGYTGKFNDWLMEFQKAGATKISIGEKVETKKALDEVAAQSSVKDPKLVEKIESKLKRTDVYFDNTDAIEAFAKQHNITSDAATDIYYKATVRSKIDDMVKQAYKDKKVDYVKGKGWYVGSKLIRRDPYATE